MKTDLERKDKLLESFQDKYEMKCVEVTTLKKDHHSERLTSERNLAVTAKDTKRVDGLKSEINSLESQTQIYQMIIRRIFRENLAIVTRDGARHKKEHSRSMANDVTRYSDSMDLLGLKANDLGMFVGDPSDDPMKKEEIALKAFDNELANRDNLDVNLIYKQINQVIGERISREQTS